MDILTPTFHDNKFSIMFLVGTSKRCSYKYKNKVDKFLLGTYNLINVPFGNKFDGEEAFTLRHWLKQKRQTANLTHEQVALKAKIARSYYTNLELNNKTPSVETAKTLGEILNFKWQLFFENEGS